MALSAAIAWARSRASVAIRTQAAVAWRGHVAEPRVPEQVVPVGMGAEPGHHRQAEPAHVVGERVELGPVDARVDEDQPTLAAHHDGVAPDPRALTDPDTVGDLVQHRPMLSGTATRRNHRGQRRR